jgi:transcriptional regulator with XRE-family HTH domain
VISKDLINQEFLLKLGKRIKTLRMDRNLSQEQLGFNAELGKNQIGCIERGEINPTICSLLAISNALGVSINELVSL